MALVLYASLATLIIGFGLISCVVIAMVWGYVKVCKRVNNFAGKDPH